MYQTQGKIKGSGIYQKKTKIQNIKPKQIMHVKIRSNKANEWPLMSIPINKAKLL